ncbi:MAG: archaea-specific SMC-related protein [Euryarchaeota archaeon]|nr:archaea-specific SMC-related protein [Euryarchaeota archaeon]
MKTVSIENIAGIRSGSATVKPGLNVVQASNFQGKSSFIASIRTVMGATGHYGDHLLTEGEDTGSVVLETNSDSYAVTVTREQGERPVRSGTPYLATDTDQVCARLFAFLGEDNPIRRAVRNGEDLTEYLQAPLELEDIDAQIRTLKEQRDAVDARIDTAETAAAELPAVQEKVTQLTTELETLRARRDELQQERVDDLQKGDPSDQLSSSKSRLQTVKNKIERIENRIERTTERKADKQSELDELTVPSEPVDSIDVEKREQRIAALRDQIHLIEDLYHANRNMLEDGDLDRITDVSRTVSGDDITCWLCGEESTKRELSGRLEAMQQTIEQLRADTNDLQEDITEYNQQQRLIEQRRSQHDRLEQEIKQLGAEIQDLKGERRTYLSKRDALKDEIQALADQLDTTESQYTETLTDVKTEIRTKAARLDEARERLETLDDRKSGLEGLREQQAGYETEIESLRTRKTETQYELKAAFDTAVSEIIDRFAPGFDHARFDIRTDPQGEIEGFELNIARDGRQTTVDALSEGEVELIGVAVALAGYRVYDVEDRTPIVLIDGISQLASAHLRKLIEYLEATTEILVTTAYPEAGDFEAHIISPDEWDVVSDRDPAPA